jgi:glycosyltransferase involved in cell wall biosynthesis
MLLDGPLKDDMRVQKEARALKAAGHRVLLLTTEEPGSAPPDLEVERLALPGGFRGTLRRFRAAWTFRDPAWESAIERFVKKNAVQVLHVHDLPLVETARRVARRLGIHVVADLHENYPYLLQRIVDTKKLRYRFVFGYERWRRHEAQVLAQVDHTIVVIEEARDRLAREAGIDPGRVSVVANYDLLDAGDPPGEPPQGFELLYVGVLNDHRGLDTTIDALPAILKAEPRARLTIVGDGPDRAKLEARARERGVLEAVRFLGWKPQGELKLAIKDAHLGLVPHEKNPLTDATIPNKLFSYMQAGKPVLVSDCAPLERIVRESASGLVFRASDPADLARAALELRDPERRRALGKSGRAACLARYHWGVAADALTSVYARFL